MTQESGFRSMSKQVESGMEVSINIGNSNDLKGLFRKWMKSGRSLPLLIRTLHITRDMGTGATALQAVLRYCFMNGPI